MSTTSPSSESSPNTPTKKKPTWGLTFVIALVLVAAAGGYYYYVQTTEGDVEPVDELKAIQGFFKYNDELREPDPAYGDMGDDLLADAPKEAGDLVNPDELVFSAVASDDASETKEVWKDFVELLASETGKKVTYNEELTSPDEQLAALKANELHITAFNTGLVPGAVNRGGFIPLFCPADASGKYAYKMEILVRKESDIKSPKDLKGKKIAFTKMSSNSGAKAPIVILKKDHNLLPGRDYSFLFSGGHKQSVNELIEGKHDAVCIATDLIAREVADGNLDENKWRVVESSPTFPPLCFGVRYNLDPELRKKIESAFAKFQFEGTSVGERFKETATQFAPVEYKKDWQFVRDIDASLAKMRDEIK